MADLTSALLTLVELSGEAMMVTGASSGLPILWVNTAFTALTGFSSGEVLGRNPRFLQCPETSHQARMEMRAAIAGGRPFRGTVLNRSRGGALIRVDLAIAPVRDADGALFAWVARSTLAAPVQPRMPAEPGAPSQAGNPLLPAA